VIRLLLALVGTVAAVFAASEWLARRGVELPEADVTPAVRTVELAANALSAALEAGAAPRTEAPEPPIVVEEEIGDAQAMPFVESPLPDDPPSPGPAEETGGASPSPAAPDAIDADASAALVRRLLAVHARMRSGG
jgi:hypothetical protein